MDLIVLPFVFTWLLVIFLSVILPVALLVALAIAIARNRKSAEAPLPPGVPTRAARDEALRDRRDRYQTERGRILGMVEQSRVSPEEGDRLIESLERETGTTSCPFCGGEIRAEAVKCRHCRRFLAEEMYRSTRLTKSRDRVIAGVCAGLADYLGVDRTLMRLLVALVVFFSGIITGLIVYLVAALILPEPE